MHLEEMGWDQQGQEECGSRIPPGIIDTYQLINADREEHHDLGQDLVVQLLGAIDNHMRWLSGSTWNEFDLTN